MTLFSRNQHPGGVEALAHLPVLQDFEAHGVGEYWIIDSDAEIVEQYVFENGAFRLLLKSGSGEISSRVVEGFRIPILAIFDSHANLTTLRNLLIQ